MSTIICLQYYECYERKDKLPVQVIIMSAFLTVSLSLTTLKPSMLQEKITKSIKSYGLIVMPTSSQAKALWAIEPF